MNSTKSAFSHLSCSAYAIVALATTAVLLAITLAASPTAYAAEIGAGDAKVAAASIGADNGNLVTQASVGSSKYALLAKNGYLYPCNAKGKKIAATWDSSNSSSISDVKKLFVAADVKSITGEVKYVVHYEYIPDSTYTTSLSYSALTNVTFLTKGGKNNCKSIADGVFASTSKLKTLTNFNKTKVITLGERAFNRSGLKSISLPKTLKRMGKGVFGYCKSLKTVSGLNKTQIASVPENAFTQCYALKSIALPKKCKAVDDYAFNSCGKMTKVTLGANVASLGNSSFNSCASLASIVLPAKLKAIGTSCFTNSTDLAKVVMKSSTMVVNRDNKAYSLSYAFYGTKIYNEAPGAGIYVPASVLNKYQSEDYNSPWYMLKDRFRAL